GAEDGRLSLRLNYSDRKLRSSESQISWPSPTDPSRPRALTRSKACIRDCGVRRGDRARSLARRRDPAIQPLPALIPPAGLRPSSAAGRATTRRAGLRSPFLAARSNSLEHGGKESAAAATCSRRRGSLQRAANATRIQRRDDQ